MICITGGEHDVAALAQRIHEPATAPLGALHEVRLDLLQTIDDDLFTLLVALAGAGRGLIVTCRSRAEGGRFAGGEALRRALLLRALGCGPAYLDVDLSTDHGLRRELYQHRGATRFVLSYHDFTGQAPWPTELESEPADLVKLAVAVTDACKLAPLRAFARGPRPAIRIGMGPAGLLSRALPARFGSPWTYAVADRAPKLAPGQLTVSDCLRYQVSRGNALVPLGLLGGPQVLTSPGPAVYNGLFHARGLDYVYLPVVTSEPLKTLALLGDLGFVGVSVTMPAKTALVAAAESLCPRARRLGALNTLVLDAGKWAGSNSDVPAVRALLELHELAGKRALVLGAGGAAKGAALGAREAGLEVFMSARDGAALATSAALVEATPIPWAERHRQPFEALINATPTGSDGIADPLPQEVSLAGRVVIDAVLCATPTPLIARARKAHARAAHDGHAWWYEQGRRQLETMLGLRVTVAELAQHHNAKHERSP